MYTGKLIFATNNLNKLEEAKHILPPTIDLATLQEIGCHEELPETHETLEENALEKAASVTGHYHVNCFSEDAGLEVTALNNEPGVYSARYAGLQKNHEDNIRLLLKNLEGKTDRSARFRAVIALCINGESHLFQGVVHGTILHEKKGSGGFGYDPVFQPDGYTRSFAEMTLEEKSIISHRKMALVQMAEWLGSQR